MGAPLTSIRGSATAMQDAAPSSVQRRDAAELRRFLRVIVDQADNMRELIDDLLDVAHIEAGAPSMSPEPVDAALLPRPCTNRPGQEHLSGRRGQKQSGISVDPRPLYR